MTETTTEKSPELLEKYRLSVETLEKQLSGDVIDETLVEKLLLEIITLRERINESLNAKEDLQLEAATLQGIGAIDAKLYGNVKLLRQRTAINPSRWQYLLPEPGDAGWWWRLHQIPVWMDDKIEYENRFSPALIPAVILIILAFALAAFSTQQMWASGEQWIGNIALIGQILVGAGLVSSGGRESASRLFNQFMNLFDEMLNRSSAENHASFPLARERSNMSPGILGAAILFFSFVLIFTTLVVPATARWFHNMGVQAVKERNVSRAEFYLELAVAVQPDFAPLPLNFSGAPSFAQLGNLYREIGNMDAAREAYENALGEDSRTVNVHYRLAEIYIADNDLTAAFAVLDRALMLLSGHMAGRERLPIGSDSEGGDNEARQLSYLSLVTRAKAFLALDNGARTALRDLDNALLAVRGNPDLFITPQNPGENRPGSLLTMDVHVLYARAYGLIFEDSCVEEAIDEWNIVRRLGRFARTSNEQLWLDEANVAIETCR